MSGRIVAEFFDLKLTGERACDRYAIQEGRVIDRPAELPDGQFRFNDGIKTYKPVMFSGGWRIIVTRETEMKPLWHGSGCYIPSTIATCPECGGELYAKSLRWEDPSGRPVASGLDMHCREDPDLNHRFHQDKWQPVRDAIAKWSGATTNAN